jgi:membrane protease subunit HflK
MSTQRADAENAIKTRIQKSADQLNLGIEIVSVTITGVHPPFGDDDIQVATEFQNVIGAMENKMTTIFDAEAYAARLHPESIASASETIAKAESYRYMTKTVANAEAERFKTQLGTYLVMPEMFKLRTYLDFLEKDCSDMRKFVVSSDLGSEVLQFNLEVKERLDLVDTDITKMGL